MRPLADGMRNGDIEEDLTDVSDPVDFGPVASTSGVVARVAEMYTALDCGDLDSFVESLSPNVRFRRGNGPVVEGVGAVRVALERFYRTVAGVRHEIVGIWRDGNVVTCELWVTYKRLDAAVASIPAVSLLRLERSEKIVDYRIFYDATPVFA